MSKFTDDCIEYIERWESSKKVTLILPPEIGPDYIINNLSVIGYKISRDYLDLSSNEDIPRQLMTLRIFNHEILYNKKAKEFLLEYLI